MVVATLYDENEEQIKEKVEKLKEYTGISNYMKEYTFKYIRKINLNTKYDVCLIFSNDIERINKYITKINDLKSCIIITGNFKTDHVLACIDITDNLSYLNSTPSIILDKVVSVYEQNKC
ncbi:MAG: hypothetical protein PHP54_00875 [Clostridia bacterium]|nr:hypothetical protein [Clostridia bacterium]